MNEIGSEIFDLRSFERNSLKCKEQTSTKSFQTHPRKERDVIFAIIFTAEKWAK